MGKDNKIELVNMIFKVSRLLKDEMSYTNDLIHLSILQIQTLVFLSKNKKASMSDIAGYFRIEMPSATSLLDKLYEEKLVDRSADAHDRRLVIITLTDKGKGLLKQAMCERRSKLEKVLSYLSTKERSDLSSIINTLNEKLHNKK